MCTKHAMTDRNPARVVEQLRKASDDERKREDAEWRRHSQETEAMYKRVVAQLRPASLQEYEKWMSGYIRVWGDCRLAPVDCPFSSLADEFFVASGRILKMEPLHGAKSINIIVPENVDVVGTDIGHCNLFFMRQYRFRGIYAMVSSDMNFE
jgi:hypothetical protein